MTIPGGMLNTTLYTTATEFRRLKRNFWSHYYFDLKLFYQGFNATLLRDGYTPIAEGQKVFLSNIDLGTHFSLKMVD